MSKQPSLASQDESHLRSNPPVGTSKAIVPSQGGPTVDNMTASIEIKAPNLGEVSHLGSLDNLMLSEGIGGKSVFSFADEAGKMFIGGIDTGALAPALQHELSEEKAGIGHLGAGNQLGAQKGPSQGIIGGPSQ